MRVIRPGKIGPIPGASRVKKEAPLQSQTSTSSGRVVWDDFTVSKSVSKKKEYTKGLGDRMIPRDTIRKIDKSEDNSTERNDAENDPKFEPRTDLTVLEESLGYQFTDKTLLSRALTHRSALGFKERADYERLEFLGDAVLDLSVAHLLSDIHPEAREGELSKMRAALVNTQALAVIARGLGVNDFVKLGRGEYSAGGADRPSILADVMEALIGAVYRDSNYETALNLVERIFGNLLTEVTPFDPKTELQEVLHAAGSEPPSYLLELVEGPEHAPTFVTVVIVDGQNVGRGRGNTKKAAQQEAAAQALMRMVYDGNPLTLESGQRFYIEQALLIPSPSELKKRPILQEVKDREVS
ncbi:MAG TPA: ribonuclease III [Oligoflexia bacterium]|nr:ribonuclease III [Oligoflexia bacterium]HMP49168.1 ribonuclease III [Oligoflexia bacterium]